MRKKCIKNRNKKENFLYSFFGDFIKTKRDTYWRRSSGILRRKIGKYFGLAKYFTLTTLHVGYSTDCRFINVENITKALLSKLPSRPVIIFHTVILVIKKN